MFTSREDYYDVVVVGMGPVGLAAAYEAAKNGKSVLILEKRPEEQAAVRPQVIVLAPERKNQLIDMISKGESLNEDDIKFLDALAHSAEIKLRDVQKFIINRINDLNKKGKRISENPMVEMHYDTTLTSVDLNVGKAKIQDQEINFTHLIAADGGHSETLHLVNQSLPDQQKIKRETPSNMKHLKKTYHLGAYVKLSRVDEGEVKLPEREFVSSFLENEKEKSHQLYFLRFDKKTHDKSDKKSVKLGFIGEMTKTKYEEYDGKINECRAELNKIKKDKNKNETEREITVKKIENDIKSLVEKRNEFAKNYVKRAAAEYLGVNEDELKVEVTNSKGTPAKDKLKVLTFQGGSKKADKASIAVNNRGFYLVGDAYFTPNYPVGHGLNDGLEASKKLGELSKIDSNSNFISEYNELTAGNANHARSMMQGIRWFRKLGAIRMKVAQFLEWAVDKREKENKINLKSIKIADQSIKNYINNQVFNVNAIADMFSGVNQKFPIGFLSVDQLDTQQLRSISNTNNDVPILVRVHQNNKFEYHFYGKNKQGEWKLSKLNNDNEKLNQPPLRRMGYNAPDELFKKNVLTILPDTTKNLNLLSNYLTTKSEQPLHYINPEPKITEKIKQWDKFLTNNPAILKQYRSEISTNLAKITDLIASNGDPVLKREFNNVYVKYRQIINKHNLDLVMMARKNPNKADASGYSPLYHAIRFGDLNTVKKVLELGADPKKAIKNGDILSENIVLQKLEIAKELFKYGANPFTRVSRGEHSPFYKACENLQHSFVVECLKAAQDPKNPLYKMARRDLSTTMIDKIVANINESSLSSPEKTEIIKLLKTIKIEKSQKFSISNAFNTLFTPRKAPANDKSMPVPMKNRR